MLTIWGRATSSNVQKVLWTCDESGVDYRRVDIGGPFGGTDANSYRALNPNGLIPTIEDGDFVLWESNAILRYLAAGDPEHRLLPVDMDRRARANIDRWMDWQLVSLGLSVRDVLWALQPPGPPGAQRGHSLSVEPAAAVERAVAMFRILNEHLAARQYVGGDQFTLGDIPVGVSTHRWFRMDVRRPSMPALELWYERISHREAFQQIKAIPLR